MKTKNKKSGVISKREAAQGKKMVAYVVVALLVMFILIFVGVKMLLAMNDYINPVLATFGISWHMPHIEIPTPWSLAIIFGVLVLSMGASYLVTKKGNQP